MSTAERILQAVFLKYSSIGSTPTSLADASLDGSKFMKIMREAKLMGGKLDAPKVDVIFMRVGRSQKRISYSQFLEALSAVAQVKGVTDNEIILKLARADPSKGVTQPDYVKFHDDKSLYSGVYAAGGPSAR